MSYPIDRAWSDRWIPLIKRTVGPCLLDEAPDSIDMSEATDLIILTARDLRIAARVRRPGYYDRYPHDLTIRSRRESGAETEHSKLLNGFADWYFYAHGADGDGGAFRRWFVIDLDFWRAYAGSHRIPPDVSNGDGTYFKPYDLRKLYKFNANSVVMSDRLAGHGQ